ncbi:dihydrodipicolinate synthase family protein [Pukyongiella litopenaei]|uniref:Dihydrodipicolinate synthase family protein n=1 Tax=Pukyongiella litopenaei TaxID=2605946 RepID=A0A2S0MKD4_9RHOB|nr:dihydrodipicolinate synthase family protein [Pukyongiella litopenaei]AVO36326.1 dihydrodipicolinate synthase family protein [Pukyongiella litopenaei]
MQGIVAAVPTPVDEDLSPMRQPFLDHCRWALANGCDGLNILGSTGEANSFDAATRRAVMGWAADALDVSRLMIGTGTPALADTIRLTLHADDLGYPVALVLPPYYYKPGTDDGLFRWFEALDSALTGRRIRIFFYNFPQMTGIGLPPGLIARLHRAHPQRFTGIKDSSGDLAWCRDLARRLPGFAVFPSSETSLEEAARSGFAGVISATVNLSAPLCGRVWADRARPDPALLDRIGTIRTAISRHPLVPAVKYLVGRQLGQPAQWTNVVPPFTSLADGARRDLDHLFASRIAAAAD